MLVLGKNTFWRYMLLEKGAQTCTETGMNDTFFVFGEQKKKRGKDILHINFQF